MAPTSTGSANRPQMTGKAASADEGIGEVTAVRLHDLRLLDCVTLAFPRFLAGFTPQDSLRMLRCHAWQVDPIFLPRTATATIGTGVTSLLQPFDNPCRMQGMALRWSPPRRIEGMVDSLGRSLDASFDARPLIPPANLVEVRHEDLVADEAGTLDMISTGLGLTPPTPPAARAAGSRPDARNVHPQLDEAVRLRLRTACRRLDEVGSNGCMRWVGTAIGRLLHRYTDHCIDTSAATTPPNIFSDVLPWRQ